MIKEVLTEYGPVNRFWFDGTKGVPNGTNIDTLWKQVSCIATAHVIIVLKLFLNVLTLLTSYWLEGV